MTRSLPRLLRRPLLLALTLAATAGTARAGDVTAFVTLSSPTDTWERGYGATLSSTWFRLLNLEAEAARVPVEAAEGTMTTFTAGAFFAPPIGIFVPYAGVGFGIFRQTVAEEGDTGTLRCFAMGLKLKLGGLFLVRGDYRTIRLAGAPLLPLDRRVSVGAGISF